MVRQQVHSMSVMSAEPLCVGSPANSVESFRSTSSRTKLVTVISLWFDKCLIWFKRMSSWFFLNVFKTDFLIWFVILGWVQLSADRQVVSCLAWWDLICWCRFVIGSFMKKRVDGVLHRLEGQELCWDRCKYGQIWHDLTVFIKKDWATKTKIDKVEVTCGDTVDGQNPAPPRMMIIPLFIGF